MDVYDIRNLNESFDVIYTSHVLAHIEDLEMSFKEMRRVLKKDGIVIHTVPTNWWSLLTNLFHYCLIPKNYNFHLEMHHLPQQLLDL